MTGAGSNTAMARANGRLMRQLEQKWSAARHELHANGWLTSCCWQPGNKALVVGISLLEVYWQMAVRPAAWTAHAIPVTTWPMQWSTDDWQAIRQQVEQAWIILRNNAALRTESWCGC